MSKHHSYMLCSRVNSNWYNKLSREQLGNILSKLKICIPFRAGRQFLECNLREITGQVSKDTDPKRFTSALMEEEKLENPINVQNKVCIKYIIVSSHNGIPCSSLKKIAGGAPGWLHQLNIQLLIWVQVMISHFRSLSPTSGSSLTVWSLLGILSPSLSYPPLLAFPLYFKINK